MLDEERTDVVSTLDDPTYCHCSMYGAVFTPDTVDVDVQGDVMRAGNCSMVSATGNQSLLVPAALNYKAELLLQRNLEIIWPILVLYRLWTVYQILKIK